jgi:hypothetical protein
MSSKPLKDRVEAIFLSAMELNSPQERETYLQRECGEDADLRREVEELLNAAVEAEKVFVEKSGPGQHPVRCLDTVGKMVVCRSH